MKFERIYIEGGEVEHPQTIKILKNLKHPSYQIIDKIENFFGKVKKPYLQKRDTLNLWIGKKAGDLVKVAPAAYGVKSVPHYYFVHAYNCIFECEYCYLQGYFNSPDIVLFVNHDEICQEISDTIARHDESQVWFHAGEFSDSLALNHITDELELYWNTFAKESRGYLELRTKSIQIKNLLSLKPLENIVISFSVSPEHTSKTFDRRTPPFSSRLKAIRKLLNHGYNIGLHLDPMIYNDDNMFTEYQQMLTQLAADFPKNQLAYMSLGVVRFSKQSFAEFSRNYPESKIHITPMIKSEDGKVKYPTHVRNYILDNIERLAIDSGFSNDKIYRCMEV